MARRSIPERAGRWLRLNLKRVSRGVNARFCASTCGALRRPSRRNLYWTEYGEGVVPSRHPATPEAWGDVVLRGRDLAASYHLAVVVDDAVQGVTDVVRGRDLLAATAVHRLLQALLGLAEPRYRHHRLVLDRDRAKLSKSRQSWSLDELCAAGFASAEVRGALGFDADADGRLVIEFG